MLKTMDFNVKSKSSESGSIFRTKTRTMLDTCWTKIFYRASDQHSRPKKFSTFNVIFYYSNRVNSNNNKSGSGRSKKASTNKTFVELYELFLYLEKDIIII